MLWGEWSFGTTIVKAKERHCRVETVQEGKGRESGAGPLDRLFRILPSLLEEGNPTSFC